MLKKLQDFALYLDYSIWYQMNTRWHTPLLDALIPFFRNQWFWAPLYLFLLVFITKNFGFKGWLWCIAFFISFSLSDYTSAALIKPIFHRARPCNNPYLTDIIHLIVPCGSGYSFPSSHASNHFCMGIFTAITLQKNIKWIWPAAICWAALVSFSQVYVGVHYPMDVTFGALVGIGIGSFTGQLFKRYFELVNISDVQTADGKH
jgi:membrane-associated phospholipid phosphatase